MKKLLACWIIAVATIALVVAVGGGVILTVNAPTARADDDCGPGYYWSSAHQSCVESPDNSTGNVTAICRDGSDSHSLSHSGTCSGHGGVAQWCPCSGTAPASASSSDSESPDPDGFIFGLHKEGMTLSEGDNAAIAGGLSVCQEARQGKPASVISQEVKNAPGNYLNFREAADFVAEALLSLCPDTDASVWADAMRLAGRNPADPNS